ncbi:unnamed protein product [Trichobilharzia regenti]|nr:unnamed protein product [Trichobilharzia regenti]
MSSHLSGSGLQVKFTAGFINRLFSPISFPCSDNDNGIMDDEIYNIEFPSLCLASIASRFVMNNNNNNNSTEENMTDSTSIVGVAPLNLELSETEENSYKITDMVECLKLQNCVPVAMPKSLVPTGSKFQNSTTKKKADRRALERGAEVIRCLCGFRVEGGHVMVQCDRCASWQHLPCLWWALSLAIRNDTNDGRNSNLACLCQTALIAAQAVGSTGEGNDVKSEGGGGSADREADAPYICPVCLKLDNLTKEYPRSLSAAMSLNDLDAVFDLQDTLVKGEHEFWTLGSPDGTCQIRTDDYAFVNRFWLDHLNTSQDISKGIIPSVHIKELLEQSQRTPVKSAYDRVIVRIYRLWKDVE